MTAEFEKLIVVEDQSGFLPSQIPRVECILTKSSKRWLNLNLQLKYCLLKTS